MLKDTSVMLGGRALAEQCEPAPSATPWPRVTAIEESYRTVEGALIAAVEGWASPPGRPTARGSI
jgi:hypothetical protein